MGGDSSYSSAKSGEEVGDAVVGSSIVSPYEVSSSSDVTTWVNVWHVEEEGITEMRHGAMCVNPRAAGMLPVTPRSVATNTAKSATVEFVVSL